MNLFRRFHVSFMAFLWGMEISEAQGYSRFLNPCVPQFRRFVKIDALHPRPVGSISPSVHHVLGLIGLPKISNRIIRWVSINMIYPKDRVISGECFPYKTMCHVKNPSNPNCLVAKPVIASRLSPYLDSIGFLFSPKDFSRIKLEFQKIFQDFLCRQLFTH